MDTEIAGRNRIAWFVLGGMALIAIVLVLRALWNRPPQMGVDESVFKTVDALYTAVRSRDEVRLTECERKLQADRDVGKLPKEAAEYLDRVIAKARAGNWETATEQLYEFMRAQRREGVIEHREKPPAKKSR